MKTNELQIGDWVTAIQDEGADVDKQWSANDYIDTNAGYCEPIPLTNDILKANGFVPLGGYGLNRLVLEDERIVISANGAFVEIYSTSAHERLLMIKRTQIYVHTIQHALRLCGLNDLADNFKLK